jgi:TatD DNase family protein
MIPSFVKMGAYFSLSPYFGHARKAQQLATFAAVPMDRLLAETDAPDMWPPDELNQHPLEHQGKPINHPANLQVSYTLLATVRAIPMLDLVHQIEQNYRRLFG